MNRDLQRLHALRRGYRGSIDENLIDIEQAKKNSTMGEFETILESIEEKVAIIKTLDEKILSQTDLDGMEEEAVQTNKYMVKLKITLYQLRDFRLGQSQMPENHRNGDDLRREEERIGQPQTKEIHEIGVGHRREEQKRGQSHKPENQETRYALQKEMQLNGKAIDPISCSTDNTVSSEICHSSQLYQLPKNSALTYNGDSLQWQSFWDSVESTIHMNADLTDAQKLDCLKSQLEGDAARVVEGFSLTNANYARAVEVLIARFGQQKSNHIAMQTWLSLHTPPNSMTSAAGHCKHTYRDLLGPVVQDKHPGDNPQLLARENGGTLQFDEFQRGISGKIGIVETGSSCRGRRGNEYVFAATSVSVAGDINPAGEKCNHPTLSRPGRTLLDQSSTPKSAQKPDALASDGSHSALLAGTASKRCTSFMCIGIT